MKTKHLFLTAILLVFSMLVVAGPVDPTRALKVAEQFAPQPAKAKRIKSKTTPEQSYEIVYTHRMPNSDRAAFYVVKLGEKGFVIISADDVANPILGYSYTNSWPTSISAEGDTILPPQVLSYLNDMALQIETAIEKYPNLESSKEWNNVGKKAVRKISARKSADALPDSVGPLLTTTWGQGQYYNALCPEDAGSEDGHVPTGCAATAMAQIINYWGQKEEIKTRGIHSYDSPYGKLTVNYDSTSYDFANMPDALTAESTPEQINAVAKLMYECGVAVNMQYSAWESGAYNEDVISALVTLFRFSPQIQGYLRFEYSDEDWLLAIKKNLAENYPIYYSGVNILKEGHAFVCDGYNSIGFVHFNFGWDGYCDGWYNLSSVDNTREVEFAYCHHMILTLHPEKASTLFVLNNTNVNISEPTDLYNILHYDISNTVKDIVMHFVSGDTTHQLVLDILDFRHHALLVYDGMTTDTPLKMLYPHHDYASQDKPTPVISNSNALTIVYSPLNYTEGFHLRISPESNCRTVSNIATQIEDSTIYISWQENGKSTEWLVEYGLKGFELGTGTQYIVQTNSISIDQAVGSDAYEIKIQPICDTLYDDYVYSVIVNERKYWSDIVDSEPEGYYLDDEGIIHISTAEGLAWLAKLEQQEDSYSHPYIYNNISIDADIDLDGYYWKPIKYWRGNLEGNGHLILNLNVVNCVDVNCEGLGMFEYFFGSVINDIGFKNAKIKGLALEHGGGTIAGHAENTKVYNTYSIDCDVVTQSESGAIFGSVNAVEMYNCYATGLSTSYKTTCGSSGGLVGRSEMMMYNSYASVDVLKNYRSWKGLLSAYSLTGSYENCYAEVDDYSTEFWGLLEQRLETKNVAYFSRESDGIARVLADESENYTLGDIDLVTALNHGVELYNSPLLKTWVLDSITGLPKFGNYYKVTCLNVSNLKLKNIVHNNEDAVVVSWTENGEATEWQIKYLREGQNDDSARYINTFSTQDTLRGIELGFVYKFYVRPLCDNGSIEHWGEPVSFLVDKPYWDEIITTQPEGYIVDEYGNIKITSAEGLTWLSVCSNGLHGQSMDHFERKKIELLADINLKGYRWRPIGVRNYKTDNTDGAFMGVFDGNNYKISDLYCSEEIATTCGLFGYAENATILNLNLSNVHIIGDISGGVAGSATQSVICNCYFWGLVKGIETSAGLIGSAYHSQLRNCSSSGDIYGDYFVGGVLGNAEDVEISNCYSIANIFQRGLEMQRFWFGGLIGQFSGDVQNCYSVGKVETVYDRFDKIVSGTSFGLLAHQVNLNCIYFKGNELSWYADSYSQCDTCISNIGLFDDNGIFQEVLNTSSNHPNNLLDALNAWVDANNTEGQYRHWVADTANINGGYPIFRQEPIALPKYIITFCNNDGTILQQDTLELGEMPEYRGGIPTKDSTEQHNYTFIGWVQELVPVTKDVAYYAQYAENINVYEITFYDWDGSVLQSGSMAYGEWPTYYNSDPWRESDAQYTYTFTGWSPQLNWVSGHQSYYAQYTSTLNQYEITFYDWDGSLLYSEMFDYGEYPVYGEPANPEREADAQYTYTFTGWDSELNVVTGAQSYTAQYEATLNQYEVTFYNWNGTLLQNGMVNYGEMPSYNSATPTRESDVQFTYTFTGWGDMNVVTGVQSYTAQYESTLNQYEVTFYNWDGSVHYSGIFNYGDWPVCSEEFGEPTRPSDAQYTYTFIGWDSELNVVTGAQSYTAQYESTLNQYQITFYDWNGEVLQSSMVNYGEMPVYTGITPTREADAQFTYTFTGWNSELNVVTGNQSYTAQYESTLNQYEVTFYNWDGTLLQSTMVNYGEMPSYNSAIPTREADAQFTYTFIGWNSELNVVTGAQSYTAQYEATLNQYEVIFYNWDGSVLQSTMVNYGEMPVYTGATPTRESDAQYTYTFTGWGDMSVVTGAQSYTAQYESTLNQYEVTFLNWDGTLLQSTMVNYGEMPVYTGATPTRESDAQYTYTFTGWSPELSEVVDDQEYTAQYDAIENDPTSMDEVSAETIKPRKVLIDEKVYIIVGETIYSAQGQKIR